MALSFVYSPSNQITPHLGCLHSGVLACISSPMKMSFSFVYVQSSYPQSRLAVTDGESLCYRVMLTQLWWLWHTPVLALMVEDKPTPCPVCAGSAQPWGAAPLESHFSFWSHTKDEELPCGYRSLGHQRAASLVQNCSEPLGLSWLVGSHGNLPVLLASLAICTRL